MKKRSMIAALTMFLATCIFSQVVFADDKVVTQGVFGMSYMGYDISSNNKDVTNCWLTKQIKQAYYDAGYKSVKFNKQNITPVTTYDYEMVLNWVSQEDWALVYEDDNDVISFGTYILATNDILININFTATQDENGKWNVVIVKQTYDVVEMR